jgi:hypothetical protein
MSRTATIIMVALILTFVFAEPAHAQFDFQGGVMGMYDDNINNNYLQIGDRITALHLNTGYNLESSDWGARFYYDGTLNYYQSIIERTNQFHSGKLNVTHYSGEEDENVLALELSFGQGYYRDGYSFYNHSLISASADYRYFLNETMINKVAYVFRSVRFAELGDFNYTEHVVTDNFSVGLPTSTTIIVQADLGGKFYPATSSADGSNQTRRGTVSITPSVTQLSGMVRIGQGIFDGTGLSLTTRYQWNIQKQTRYLSSSYGVISDDELFDDHYGYEGLQTSLMLTQVLSESMLLRITGGWQNKIYSTLGAFDLAGNQIADSRLDNRSYVSLYMQKEFDLGFTLKGTYEFIRNSSNDLYYDYRNNAATFQVSVPF